MTEPDFVRRLRIVGGAVDTLHSTAAVARLTRDGPAQRLDEQIERLFIEAYGRHGKALESTSAYAEDLAQLRTWFWAQVDTEIRAHLAYQRDFIKRLRQNYADDVALNDLMLWLAAALPVLGRQRFVKLDIRPSQGVFARPGPIIRPIEHRTAGLRAMVDADRKNVLAQMNLDAADFEAELTYAHPIARIFFGDWAQIGFALTAPSAEVSDHVRSVLARVWAELSAGVDRLDAMANEGLVTDFAPILRRVIFRLDPRKRDLFFLLTRFVGERTPWTFADVLSVAATALGFASLALTFAAPVAAGVLVVAAMVAEAGKLARQWWQATSEASVDRLALIRETLRTLESEPPIADTALFVLTIAIAVALHVRVARGRRVRLAPEQQQQPQQPQQQAKVPTPAATNSAPSATSPPTQAPKASASTAAAVPAKQAKVAPGATAPSKPLTPKQKLRARVLKLGSVFDPNRYRPLLDDIRRLGAKAAERLLPEDLRRVRRHQRLLTEFEQTLERDALRSLPQEVRDSIDAIVYELPTVDDFAGALKDSRGQLSGIREAKGGPVEIQPADPRPPPVDDNVVDNAFLAAHGQPPNLLPPNAQPSEVIAKPYNHLQDVRQKQRALLGGQKSGGLLSDFEEEALALPNLSRPQLEAVSDVSWKARAIAQHEIVPLAKAENQFARRAAEVDAANIERAKNNEPILRHLGLPEDP